MATAIRNDFAFPTTAVLSESANAMSVGNRRRSRSPPTEIRASPASPSLPPFKMIDNAFNDAIASAGGGS